MTEPIVVAALSTAGKVTQGVLTRLFGPTAEIMGEQLASWYKRKNVENVIRQAETKANTDRDGSIPPRVAQEVFEKAQWAEDEFVAEYLSGVLASARTADGQSDSGVAWTALVGRLSSDQLALHWLLYTSAQRRSRNSRYEGIWSFFKEQVVIELTSLFQALEWPFTDGHSIIRLYEATYGLRREGLIADLSHGSGHYLENEVVYTRGRKFEGNRLYVTLKLTADGTALLLQALGQSRLWIDAFLGPEVAELVDRSGRLPHAPTAALVSDFASAEDPPD